MKNEKELDFTLNSVRIFCNDIRLEMKRGGKLWQWN